MCSRRHLEFELMIMISCVLLNFQFPWQRHQDLPNDANLRRLGAYLGYGENGRHEMNMIPGIRDNEKDSDGHLREECVLQVLKRFMTACNSRRGNIGGGQGGSRFLRTASRPRYRVRSHGQEAAKRHGGGMLKTTKCCICLRLGPKGAQYVFFSSHEGSQDAKYRRCLNCVSFSISFSKSTCIWWYFNYLTLDFFFYLSSYFYTCRSMTIMYAHVPLIQQSSAAA